MKRKLKLDKLEYQSHLFKRFFNRKIIALSIILLAYFFAFQAYNILSTFKFLDQIDTANWKTYTSQQYGFQFKYPNEYKASEPAKIIGNQYPLVQIESTSPKQKNIALGGQLPSFVPVNASLMSIYKTDRELDESFYTSLINEGYTRKTIQSNHMKGEKFTKTDNPFKDAARVDIRMYIRSDSKNAPLFTIEATATYEPNAQEIPQILDQIISTFTFTNQ